MSVSGFIAFTNHQTLFFSLQLGGVCEERSQDSVFARMPAEDRPAGDYLLRAQERRGRHSRIFAVKRRRGSEYPWWQGPRREKRSH